MRIYFLNADQPLAIAAGSGVPEESSYAAGLSLVSGRLRRAGTAARAAQAGRAAKTTRPIWPSLAE